MADHQQRHTPGQAGLPYRSTRQPRTRLGARLRDDRLARNLTQKDVADALGIEQSKLSAYELGKIRMPPRERLIALARLYDLPEDTYTSLIDWSNGSRAVAQMTLPGSIVIERPRPGVAYLLELIDRLDDADLAHIIDDAAFLVAQVQQRQHQH